MSNLPTTWTGTAIFCLVIDKLLDICHEYQQHNSFDTWIETTWITIFANWWSLVFVAKISNFNIFWKLLKNNWSKTRSIQTSQRNKKCLYNHKSVKGIKINIHTAIEQASIMNKVSDVLPEKFNQDPLETYFCKQHPPGAWKDKLPLYAFGYDNSFQNQKVFKSIATG